MEGKRKSRHIILLHRLSLALLLCSPLPSIKPQLRNYENPSVSLVTDQCLFHKKKYKNGDSAIYVYINKYQRTTTTTTYGSQLTRVVVVVRSIQIESLYFWGLNWFQFNLLFGWMGWINFSDKGRLDWIELELDTLVQSILLALVVF